MHFPKLPIPFFVADRPMSLEALQHCEIHKQDAFFGLMGHANTTRNFQKKFNEFPDNNIYKMVDSGVFTKEGCKLEYKNLFDIYDRMGADYGIMIDFLKDKNKTLESANLALESYENQSRRFNLVGVAQGNNLKEYMDCFDELRSMGFNFLAIGGLLEKKVNSARYVHVKDEKFLKNVLEEIRSVYPNRWVFTLGCYHPKRHNLLKDYGVFGADYKGWIFNYKTPKQILEIKNRELKNDEKELCLENTNLNDLLEERDSIHKQTYTKKTSTEKKELERELRLIDNKILENRKKIAKKANNENYSFNIKNFEKFLKMNRTSKRKHRFNQIKGYLYRNVYSHFKDKLLIISCSQRKTDVNNPAPAFEIYDGPFYRMLKKNDEKIADKFHIIIISAKYGILSPYDPIEKYNQKMTRRRAKELNKSLKKELTTYLEINEFKDIFISLGKDYKLALTGIDFRTDMKEAEGGIGKKLSQTKKWINS